MDLTTVFFPQACDGLPYTKAIIPKSALKMFLDMGFVDNPLLLISKPAPEPVPEPGASPDLDIESHKAAIDSLEGNKSVSDYVKGFTGKDISWRGKRESVVKRAIETIQEFLSDGNS